MPTEETTPAETPPRFAALRGRLAAAGGWLKAHRRLAIIVATVAVASVGVGLGAWYFSGTKPRPPALDAALAALDAGNYEEARTLAEELAAADLPPAEAGMPAFLKGAAAAYVANGSSSDQRAGYYAKAAALLADARTIGVPDARRGELTYLLGLSLLGCDRIAQARPLLEEALPTNRRREAEIRGLLAQTWLLEAKPAEALVQNTAALAALPAGDAQHDGLRLQRADILLLLGRRDEACATVQPVVGRLAAEAIVVRARALMAAAEQSKPRPVDFAPAVKLLREAQAADWAATGATRKAMYLIGLCLAGGSVPDAQAALDQWARLRRTYPGTAEARASLYQEARTLRVAGKTEAALAAYAGFLATVPDPDAYANAWLPLEEVRTELVQAAKHYFDAREYRTCLALSKVMTPVATALRACEIAAESHAALGRQLIEASRAAAADAERLAAEGRAELRRAGAAYRTVAKGFVADRRYPEELWNASVCLLEGGGYADAAETLAQYLATESRKHLAEAYARRGDALSALGRHAEALAAYNECLGRYPQDIAAFYARLGSARCHAAAGDFAAAERLLKENLQAELITPASAEWRESLFELGSVLHAAGRFDEAAARLDEAAARYPDSPRLLETLYLNADAWRQHGRGLRAGLANIQVEQTRLKHARQAAEATERALAAFNRLRDALQLRQEKAELPPSQRQMLRNAYFAIGEALFDLGRHDEAVKAYIIAVHRVQHSPEAVAACVQMARAYRLQEKPAEARAALDQARGLLPRIKDDVDFRRTTSLSRAEWQEAIARLTALY